MSGVLGAVSGVLGASCIVSSELVGKGGSFYLVCLIWGARNGKSFFLGELFKGFKIGLYTNLHILLLN